MSANPRRTLRAIRRTALFAFVGLLGLIAALYVFLLTAQWISVRKAERVLTRLEALRVGDPVSDFQLAVEGCRFEDGVYLIEAGAYRVQPLASAIWKLPQDWADWVFYYANRAGLRAWDLRVSANVSEQKIARVGIFFMVVGRYEMLGTRWNLQPKLPAVYVSLPLKGDDLRTYLHWFHITSFPSGEGLAIDASSQSTPKRAPRPHHQS
jgi:hypothetical protein